MRFETQFAIVSSGAQIADVELRGADLFGLWAPAVDSCAITLRGSWDQTSANYKVLTNPAGSGDWTFAVGPGDRAITLQDVAFPWPYLRIVCAVAQTVPRSLAVVTKL